MLSEEMYYLIKQAPREGNGIPYQEIKVRNPDTKFELVCEAVHNRYDYLNSIGNMDLTKSTLRLTENGQAAIEAYEQDKRNQHIMEKSLSVANKAMWAAVFSAIAAIISLVITLLSSWR